MKGSFWGAASAAALLLTAVGAHAADVKAEPGTTQTPANIYLVNTGDFWLGISGQADMMVEMASVNKATGAAANTGNTNDIFLSDDNSDYGGSRFIVEADDTFAKGWDVLLHLESEVNIGTGATVGTGAPTSPSNAGVAVTSSQFWNKASYVKLNSADFGSLIYGRIYTTTWVGTGYIEALNLDLAAGGLTTGGELFDGLVRSNNTLLYQSPLMNGFRFDAGVYNMGYGTNGAAAPGGVSPNELAKGGLMGGLNYWSPDNKLKLTFTGTNYYTDSGRLGGSNPGFTIATGGTAGNAPYAGAASTGSPYLLDLGGQYNFGSFTGFAYLGHESGTAMSAAWTVGTNAYTTVAGTKSDQWVGALGVQIPFGNNKIIPSISYSRENASVTSTASGGTVHPADYKLALLYFYYFTPSVWLEADTGYIWNKDGSSKANGAGQIDPTKSGSQGSLAAEAGFHLTF